MANVQPENGGVLVAHDLYLAIASGRFTTVERGVIDGVAYLTYGAHKTKAEIATEDIRYLLGADESLRTDRLNEAINRLIARRILFRQELTNGKQLLGLQKDYDQWADKTVPPDKLSPTLQGSSLEVNTKTHVMVPDNLSPTTPPERLLAYAQEKSGFRYSLPKWRIERKYAKQVYMAAIAKTKSGDAAYQMVCDYIDQDDWMRDNVRMQFTYMSTRIGKWMAQIPRKDRNTLENEEATNRRYRYNVKLKQWQPAPVAAKEV